MLRDYLVMYDICDPKRLAKVFKLMKGFGRHLQYSVFQCDLTEADMVRMKMSLAEVVDHREDQVLIFDLGKTSGSQAELVEAVGRAYERVTRAAVVV